MIGVHSARTGANYLRIKSGFGGGAPWFSKSHSIIRRGVPYVERSYIQFSFSN